MDRIRGQMKAIRKERYRIARETKFLQLQENALKQENVDLRNKINEILIAKLQRGPLQSIENLATGVSSSTSQPNSTSAHHRPQSQGIHNGGRRPAMPTAGPMMGRNTTPNFREPSSNGHDRRAPSTQSHNRQDSRSDSKNDPQKKNHPQDSSLSRKKNGPPK